MKPAIFLDIDGVLMPYAANRPQFQLIEDLNVELAKQKNWPGIAQLDNKRVNQFYYAFDQDALNYIRQLQQEFRAEIIITSSWRMYYNFDALQSIFKIFDIEIHDVLPSGLPRFQTILDYARQHQLKYWIAIDDMDMKKGLGPHFVACDNTFKEENYQEARRKLAIS